MPIAHNKETGETLYLAPDGQWKPAKTAENPDTQERMAFDGSEWKPIQAKEVDKPWYEDVDDFATKATDYLNNASRSILNTASFGLTDKYLGALSGLRDYLWGSDKPFKESYYEPKRERQEWERENPKTSFGTTAVGAMLNPVAKPAGQFISKGAGLLGQSGRSALVGSGWAGTQALGESEGPLTERLKQTIGPVAAGGAIGGLVPGAFALGKYGINQTFGRMKGLSDKAGFKKVFEALEADGLTPEQGLDKVVKMGPRAALMDAGPNSRALTYGAGKVPGKGMKTIRDFVEKRQRGVIDPVTKDLKGGQSGTLVQMLDDMVPENYLQTKAGIEASKKAAPLYASAYKNNQHIESDVVDRILRLPEGKAAMRYAVKLMRMEGKNVSRVDPELTAMLREQGEATGRGVGRGLKLETLDYIKRALGEMEKKSMRTVGFTKESTELSRAYTKVRKQLTEALDAADVTARAGPNSLKPDGGDYAKARALAGEKFDHKSALRRGTEWMKGSRSPSPEAMKQELAALSPEERHLFRIGAVDYIKTLMGSKGRGADLTKLFTDNPNVLKKVKMVFGDDDMYRKFVQVLENEGEMYASRAHLQTGSRTAENLAAMKDAKLFPSEVTKAINEFSVLNPASYYRLMTSFGGERGMGGITGPMSDRIAGLMTGRNIQQVAPRIRNLGFGQEGQVGGGNFFRDALILGGAANVGKDEGPLTKRLKSNRR